MLRPTRLLILLSVCASVSLLCLLREAQAGNGIEVLALRDAQHGRFLTSKRCALCHSNAGRSNAMRDAAGGAQAPFDLWQASSMANAFRDPFFRATLAAEMQHMPDKAAAIEDKCLSCHAPMAAYEQHAQGEKVALKQLVFDSDFAQIGNDGVSCALCHQIEAEGLGSEESYTAGFRIGDEGKIFGPHAQPFTMPMRRHTSYTPTESPHILQSNLCGSCHTVITEAHTALGEGTGTDFLEQGTYLEWKNSAFNDEVPEPGPYAASCQACHMPTTADDGTPIKTRIARRPNGTDFPPIAPRQTYGRHLFVGANVQLPALLRDHADDLLPQAPAEAFDRVIELTEQMVGTQTARLQIGALRVEDGSLLFEVQLQNLAGHKFPSGYPSRRAWLRTEIRAPDGSLLFLSGAVDAEGRLVDGAGEVLASEQPGGAIQAHYQRITGEGQVQIYQTVMAGADGEPTWRLMEGARMLKDNRLLPMGFRDDHPEAARTAPVGTAGDQDFQAGEDTIQFALAGLGEVGSVRCTLLYQSFGGRVLAELARFEGLDEVSTFMGYLDEADRTPLLVAEDVVEVAGE